MLRKHKSYSLAVNFITRLVKMFYSKMRFRTHFTTKIRCIFVECDVSIQEKEQYNWIINYNVEKA